jgi:hypothetical protein
MDHAWTCFITFSSCRSGIPDEMDQQYGVLVTLIKIPRIFSLGTQKGYRLCYRSRRRPRLATTNTEWNWDVRTRPGIFQSVRQSLLRRATYCVKLKVDSFRAIFHLQKATTRKPCFRMSVCIKHSFVLLCRRPPIVHFCRFGHSFSFILSTTAYTI